MGVEISGNWQSDRPPISENEYEQENIKKLALAIKQKCLTLLTAGFHRSRTPAMPEETERGRVRKIDETTIYEAKELCDLLKGAVKLQTLRRAGLVGLPGGGYWGKSIIQAIDRITGCSTIQASDANPRLGSHDETKGCKNISWEACADDEKPGSGCLFVAGSMDGKQGKRIAVSDQRERFIRLISPDPDSR